MKKALTLVAILCMAAMLFAGCDLSQLLGTPAHTHTPEADDGNCLTAVVCAECREVVVEAKEAHVPGEDDGDCTTAVKCVHCDQDAVAAQEAHVPGEDDNNCATAVKCVNCEKNAVEAKNHEAGEDDGDCTTAVKCAHCDEIAVAAKDAHVPGEDDGDVTTAVTCKEANCNHIFVEAKEAISMTVLPFENGTVESLKKNYAAGDVVTFGVLPNQGYNIKCFIVKKDGEVVTCDVVENSGARVYTFTAEQGEYTIEVAFAKPIFSATKHNWDFTNQYNGSVTLLNKTADGSAITTVEKNYKEVSVLVKDHTPSLDADGNIAQGNFSAQIAFIFDDGKQYEVRIHNTDSNLPNYKIQTVGSNNSVTGTKWPWLADLTAEQKDRLMNGNGVVFSVKLNGSVAEMWVDGAKMAAVDLGADYNGKAAQVKICLNGSKTGENIVLPFALSTEYTDPIFSVTKGHWDLSNQNSGSITIANKGSSTASVKTLKDTYREVSVTISDLAPSFADTGKGNFKMEIDFDFACLNDAGETVNKKLQIRIDNELGNGVNGEYRVLNMGSNIITGWNPKYYVTTDQAAATKIRTEEGVTFRVALEGTNAVVYLDGNKLFEMDLSVGGITAESTAAITLLMEGNVGVKNIEIPFTIG